MNKIQIEIVREMIDDRRRALQQIIDTEKRKLITQRGMDIPQFTVRDGLPIKAQKILESVIPKMQEFNSIVREFNAPIEEKIKKLEGKYHALWYTFDEVKEKIMIKLAFSKNTMDEVEELLKLLPSIEIKE